MNNKLLKQFFKENPVESDTPTAPAFAHFNLSLESNPKAREELLALMSEEIFDEQPGRKADMLAERHEIEAITTCEQTLRQMRRHIDPLNQHILVDKAFAFEDEIIPEIIRMLKTSMNSPFIETAIRVLAKSEKDIAQPLINIYKDMRSPYAQSMVLVVLGYKVDETCIAWLIDQYKKLKRLYPDESYCEGAYYALVEIENRFF